MENAEFLGAPLFAGQLLDTAWTTRCDDLSRAADRLASIGSQDALILLRASFSAPRVQHLLRCSPSSGNAGLTKFDSILRSTIDRITNSNLSDTEWLQASMPIKLGGLGLRQVCSLAIPAFLASAASTLSLQDSILAAHPCDAESAFLDYIEKWSTSFGTPSEPLSGKQSYWDRPGLQRDRAAIECTLNEPTMRARYSAATASHSGDWLLALPIASCGLKLDDEAVRVAVGLRLGLNVCVPHTCRCGAVVDAHGLHCMVCKQAPGRTVRHQALNDTIWRAFGAAGIPATKEPTGLTRLDGKRPDGLTLIPWQAGRPLTWDVTVVATLAESYLSTAVKGAGAVAELAASRKTQKYSELAHDYIFQPIAFENMGAINSSALETLSDLGRKLTCRSGEEHETIFLLQRLSVILQRFNSVLLHDTFTTHDDPDQ